MAAFFDPLTGGPEQTGWPFGRAVYASEVSRVLERRSLVDYVEDVQLATPAGVDRVQTDDGGGVVGIELDAHELVRLGTTALVAYRRSWQAVPVGAGATWTPTNPPRAAISTHLPAMFREEPFVGSSCGPSRRCLSGTDAEQPGLETTISHLADYLDPATTKAEFLPWLAGWVTLSLRADWDEATKRSFIQQIVPLYRPARHQSRPAAHAQLYTGQLPQIDDDFEQPAHFFQVRLKLSEADPELLQRKQEIAQAIIDQEKPAHTFYALQVAVPTMRLVSKARQQELKSPLLDPRREHPAGDDDP